MKALPGIAVYNQDRLSDEEFVANFVARHNSLEQLLDELRAMAHGGDTRNMVIIGARGMGKSTMLRRVAIAVQKSEDLAADYMPLSFREEQYNVISSDAFWRNCGEALAEWCEREGRQDLAEALDRAVDSDEWRDAEKSRAAFQIFCGQIGRRPLLLLDNLDIILDGLDEKNCWSLREVLQSASGPVVIGGATKLLSQGADRNAPFYEFFYPHFLEPLSEAELLVCMHALAGRRGKAGARVKKILTREPNRVRTLYALTGGNPRVLALIYQVFERADTGDVFADLEALLDQVTPFYKARIEEYQTPQQRAVIDAIALHWDPIGSRALADATGIEVTTISSHLNRLRKDGVIEEVESSTARSSYQLAERFLNIWYLMRHGTRRTRQRLRWLTLFLVRLFSADELRRMAEEARPENITCRWNSDYREAVLAAQELLGKPVEMPMSNLSVADISRMAFNGKERDLNVDDIFKKFNESHELILSGDYSSSLIVTSRLIEEVDQYTGNASSYIISMLLVNKGFLLGQLGRSDEELVAYDEILTRFGSSKELLQQRHIAVALFNKAVAFSRGGKTVEALSTFDEVLARYGESNILELQDIAAQSLVEKGVIFSRLGRVSEELEVYRDVVQRYTASKAIKVQVQVARALLNTGLTLSQLDRIDDEKSVYDDIFDRYANSEKSELQEIVALAMLSKAAIYRKIGANIEELNLYDEVVRRYASSDVLDVQEQVASALISKGLVFSRLERSEDELGAYDDVLRLYRDSKNPALQASIAQALLNKGMVFSQLGQVVNEIEVYDELIHRYTDSESSDLREFVSKALVNKGVVLKQDGKAVDGIALYDQVLSRHVDAKIIAEQVIVAHALFNKGLAYKQIEEVSGQISAYDEVVARYANSSTPELQEVVAQALLSKGILFKSLGQIDDGLAVHNEIVNRIGDSQIHSLRVVVARALFSNGMTFGRLDQMTEALKIYDELITRFSNDDEPEMQQIIARTLLLKGRTLRDIGDGSAAVIIFDEIIARYKESRSSKIEEIVTDAYVGKGNYFLDKVGDALRAEEVYREAIINNNAIIIRANLAWALLRQGKIEDVVELRITLDKLDAEGRNLIDAATHLVQNNLGLAAEFLSNALSYDLNPNESAFFEDLLRFIQLGGICGHGEYIVTWFRGSGYSDKYAPVYAATVAFVQGARYLRDFSPEVRGAAQKFYEFLKGPHQPESNSRPKDKGGYRKRTKPA